MISKIDKPYVLRVAELIYSKIIEIKNQNPEVNNIQAFEIFMTTKDYDFISSGEFHDNWISELKDNDFIEDTVIDSPVDVATEDSLHFATDDILGSLTAREAKVLRMRFGIGMNTDHTLEEVGKQFDVTRERIRQIEAKALRKLRHPSRSSHLKSFLDE